MNNKDSMLFPITDIFDLSDTLANLSDEGLSTLQIALENDYGIRLEFRHKEKVPLDIDNKTAELENEIARLRAKLREFGCEL